MTLARLTPVDLAAIRDTKPLLVRASEACSITWQMLAAIWYREGGLQQRPNAFQFDPVPSHDVMFGLLQAHSDLDIGQKSDVLGGGVEQFYSCAVLAACWLCCKCKMDLAIDHSDAAVMDAFYGYNGRAYGADPLNSPYVSNELDDHHSQMHFRGTIGGKWVDLIDKRPGAFTVYRQLMDLAGEPQSSSPPALSTFPTSETPLAPGPAGTLVQLTAFDFRPGCA